MASLRYNINILFNVRAGLSRSTKEYTETLLTGNPDPR